MVLLQAAKLCFECLHLVSVWVRGQGLTSSGSNAKKKCFIAIVVFSKFVIINLKKIGQINTVC